MSQVEVVLISQIFARSWWKKSTPGSVSLANMPVTMTMKIRRGVKKKNIKSPTNVSSIEHLIQFVEIVELYSKLITSKLEVFQIFQVGFKIVLVVIFAGGSTTCPRIYG